MKLGLQMWSVHNECVEQGIPTVIKLIKGMGYEGFEYALGDSVNLQERCGANLVDVKKALKEYDIQAIGSHISLEKLLIDTDLVLRECLELGIPYAAIGPAYFGDRTPHKEQKRINTEIAKVAKIFKRNGIQLQVHCSAFGFLKDYKGRYTVEGMFEDVGLEYLQPEFDTAWMICGEVNPIDFLYKYRNYIDILHFKDFHPLKEKYYYIMTRHNTICDENYGCAIGENGVQDIEGIINAAKECGTKWVITELWNEPDSLKNAEISANNIRKYL